MNRIIFQPEEIAGNGQAVVTGRRAEHLRNVLRVECGDLVRIGIIDGGFGEAEVLSAGDGRIVLQCRIDPSFNFASPAVDLLLAMPRPKVLKRLWSMLACVGVRRIMLTNAARVEPEYFATHWLHPDNRNGLLQTGLEQSGDVRFPEVTLHRRFKPFVEDELGDLLPQSVLRCVADLEAKQPFLRCLDDHYPQHLCLAIGPEGGWVPFELELLYQQGFLPVSLGERVLRSDLACISGLSIWHAWRRNAHAQSNSLKYKA